MRNKCLIYAGFARSMQGLAAPAWKRISGNNQLISDHDLLMEQYRQDKRSTRAHEAAGIHVHLHSLMC